MAPRNVSDKDGAPKKYGLIPSPRIYPNRISRSVDFSRRTRVYLVPTLEEMSSQEFYAVYGSDEDSRTNQAGVVDSIRNMRLGVRESDDTYTCRGLEHMRSQAHMDQRRINKDMLFDAVLDEQDRQIGEGVIDDEALAEIAARMSQRARDAALALASSDEAYVRRYRKEEEEEEKECAAREAREAASDADCINVLGSALGIAPPTTSNNDATSKNNSSLPSVSIKNSSSSPPPNRRRAVSGLNRNIPFGNAFLSASASTTKITSTTTTSSSSNNISKSKSVEAMLNQMSIRSSSSSAAYKTASSSKQQSANTSALGDFSRRSRALST